MYYVSVVKLEVWLTAVSLDRDYLYFERACPDGQGIDTVCSLSLNTAWVHILVRACEKVASDFGLGGVFCR